MRIKNLTVKGFRGFNKERSLDFHDKLTVLYGPNSYGKTSISESFEWLIYGVTSKVESAQSKLEYKGSYRNLHFPESDTAFVTATFLDDDSEIQLTSELVSQDEYLRRIGQVKEGDQVEVWPFEKDLEFVPKPFILQHALKYLLLGSPKARFQGFAQLLGFEQLDKIHQDVISLCTKPKVPENAKKLQQDIAALQARIKKVEVLTAIDKQFDSKDATVNSIYQVVMDECSKRVPGDV